MGITRAEPKSQGFSLPGRAPERAGRAPGARAAAVQRELLRGPGAAAGGGQLPAARPAAAVGGGRGRAAGRPPAGGLHAQPGGGELPPGPPQPRPGHPPPQQRGQRGQRARPEVMGASLVVPQKFPSEGS